VYPLESHEMLQYPPLARTHGQETDWAYYITVHRARDPHGPYKRGINATNVDKLDEILTRKIDISLVHAAYDHIQSFVRGHRATR